MKLVKSTGEPAVEAVVVCISDANFLSGKNLLFTSEELDYINKSVNKKITEFSFIKNGKPYSIYVSDEKNSPQNYEKLRKYGHSASNYLNKINAKKILFISNLDEVQCYAFLEGLTLSSYKFLKYFTGEENKNIYLEEVIVDANITENKLIELEIITNGVNHTRDLVNEPLINLNALAFSNAIEELGKIAGFSVEVFHKEKIKSLKMGGLLAVNKGSIDPPTFNILEWKPDNCKNSSPILLVGKGIVYDTGGLSLKPTADSMDYMKCDMAGGAVVVGTMYNIAMLKLPFHVIALVPATDNRPSGNAYVPGDVITMYNGKTVEVLNTDAEGRLILADALSYADKYNPELVIDVATLTGAAAVAIGDQGLVGMKNETKGYFDKLKLAGESTYERVAEFPFWDEYNELLKSDIADLKNIGGRSAGAITAGKFLEHFTTSPYIHLDIAGVAFTKTPLNYKGKGATGTGVRLLTEFFKNL